MVLILYKRVKENIKFRLKQPHAVKYPSGHILLQSGTKKENDEFYVLEKGRLDFEMDGKLVAEIDEVGGFFGELSLLHTAVSERTVLIYGSAGRAGRLLRIKQKTFRGILNMCSKRAEEERKEALLSVDFLSTIIKENDELIRKHAGDLLVEFPAPDIGIRFSQTQVLYVSYQMEKTMLTGCNVLFHG